MKNLILAAFLGLIGCGAESASPVANTPVAAAFHDSAPNPVDLKPQPGPISQTSQVFDHETVVNVTVGYSYTTYSDGGSLLIGTVSDGSQILIDSSNVPRKRTAVVVTSDAEWILSSTPSVFFVSRIRANIVDSWNFQIKNSLTSGSF
jgi:hypothetical protein